MTDQELMRRSILLALAQGAFQGREATISYAVGPATEKTTWGAVEVADDRELLVVDVAGLHLRCDFPAQREGGVTRVFGSNCDRTVQEFSYTAPGANTREHAVRCLLWAYAALRLPLPPIDRGHFVPFSADVPASSTWASRGAAPPAEE